MRAMFKALKSPGIGIATATCRSEGVSIVTRHLILPNVRGARLLYPESQLVHG